jgi:prepilin-type N-terminal cleavage/methylation domain-containing protein
VLCHERRAVLCHERAFTLLEVIVALALASVVALALANAFGTGRAAERALERLQARTRPLASLAQALQADLGSVVRPAGVLSGAFVADDRALADPDVALLAFTTDIGMAAAVERARAAPAASWPAAAGSGAAAPARPPFADRVVVEYHVRETPADSGAGGDTLELVRVVRAGPLVEQAADDDALGTPLLEGIRALDVRVFDGSTWQSAWDSTASDNRLPALVGVAATLADGRRLGFVVRPALAVAATAQGGGGTP